MIGLKEQIAERIFPFQLYLSGKFNHSDIINAMCEMAEIFESFYSNSLIQALGIEQIKHIENDSTANGDIK